MTRKFTEDELVVATHNKGKLVELKAMFGAKVKKLSSAADYNLEAIEETGTTFSENALLKAQFVAKATGKVALADDSGLCIDALEGAPGVYSADWAEPDDKNLSPAEKMAARSWPMAMEKVRKLMGDNNPNPKAHFTACLALAWPDGHYEIYEGFAHGKISFPARGTNGFGFDPIFVPDGETRTYGEMTSAEKEGTSHRSDAFKKLIAGSF